ncbi:MAG: DUF1934 domain-containing protein [Eubacterium sp.]|nr:DUF1934 domain-containing protein [Eubacterium sp.]
MSVEKKEVRIKISSKHDYGMGEMTPIEVVSLGELYHDEDGFDCLTYEEVVDEDENGTVQVVNNTLRIGETQVELIKGGDASSHMVFVPNQKTISYLPSPAGELEIGVHTAMAEKTVYTNGFTLRLKYELEMNQTMISTCGLSIAVVDNNAEGQDEVYQNAWDRK